jgi:Flp pilus assembly pilin Flp
VNDRQLFVRFLHEEAGQDIIEYALLCAFLGVIGVVAWQGVKTGLHSAYSGWDSGVQNLSSCTPDPISAGGACSGS